MAGGGGGLQTCSEVTWLNFGHHTAVCIRAEDPVLLTSTGPGGTADGSRWHGGGAGDVMTGMMSCMNMT